MYRLIFAAFLMTCFASLLMAQNASSQSYPRIEVFAGYLYSHDTPYTVFDFGTGTEVESSFATHHGVEASVIRNLNRYLGIKADFSAHFHHDSFTVTACGVPCVPQPGELNPKLLNFLGGPELKKRNHTKFTPFVHALFGVAHESTSFKTSGPVANLTLTNSETGFAMAFGGGVDIRLARRFSLRASADYNPAWIGRDDDGNRQRQNDLRISMGILFH